MPFPCNHVCALKQGVFKLHFMSPLVLSSIQNRRVHRLDPVYSLTPQSFLEGTVSISASGDTTPWNACLSALHHGADYCVAASPPHNLF